MIDRLFFITGLLCGTVCSFVKQTSNMGITGKLDVLFENKSNKPKRRGASASSSVTNSVTNSGANSSSLTSGYGSTSTNFSRQLSSQSSGTGGGGTPLQTRRQAESVSTMSSDMSSGGASAQKVRKSAADFETIYEEDSKTGRCFEELLIEAELRQYLNCFQTKLGVTTISQARFVEDSDLQLIGMSGPEMRRFKHFYDKITKKPGPFTRVKHMMFPKSKSFSTRSMPIRSKSIPRNSHLQPQRTTSHVQTDEHPNKSGATLSQRTEGVSLGAPFSSGGSVVLSYGGIIPCDQIDIKSTIGEGEFGVVKSAVWTNEQGYKIEVAVKIVTAVHVGDGAIADFMNEAEIMRSLQHPHLCKMYGLSINNLDGHRAVMLVTELAQDHSLLEALVNDAGMQWLSFTVDRLCLFAAQICEGMEYLEKKRYIHRDLAARNILVFRHDLVKVSDFGLSRVLSAGKDYYQTQIKPNLRLPIAWCAPECGNFLKFTSASDVWAYGVTLWEMFSYGAQPWGDLNGNEIIQITDLPHCRRLEQPFSCPTLMYNSLMMRCWEHNPQERPTFAQITQLLPKFFPQTVKAKVNYIRQDEEELNFNVNDVIYVLEERAFSQWKGVNQRGEVGTFKPSHTTANIDVQRLEEEIRQRNINYNSSHDYSVKTNTLSTQHRPQSLACRPPQSTERQLIQRRHDRESTPGTTTATTPTPTASRLNSVSAAIVTSRHPRRSQLPLRGESEVDYDEAESSVALTEVSAFHSEDDYSLGPPYGSTNYNNTPLPRHNLHNNQQSAFPFANHHFPSSQQRGLRVDSSSGPPLHIKQVVQVKPFNREQDFSLSEETRNAETRELLAPQNTESLNHSPNNLSRFPLHNPDQDDQPDSLSPSDVIQRQTDALNQNISSTQEPEGASAGFSNTNYRSNEEKQSGSFSPTRSRQTSQSCSSHPDTIPSSHVQTQGYSRFASCGGSGVGIEELGHISTGRITAPSLSPSPSNPASIGVHRSGSTPANRATEVDEVRHQRSVSDTGGGSVVSKTKRAMAADQAVAVNDRAQLLGGATSPTAIPQGRQNPNKFLKNLLSKQTYTDEKRNEIANKMIAPGSSPTKYFQAGSYPNSVDSQFDHQAHLGDSYVQANIECRTLPRIMTPKAKTQVTSSGSISRGMCDSIPNNFDSTTPSPPITNYEDATLATSDSANSNYSSNSPATNGATNVPAIPPRVPISPLSTPDQPGTPTSPLPPNSSKQAFFPASNNPTQSHVPPVPPRATTGTDMRLYQRRLNRSNTTYHRRQNAYGTGADPRRPISIQRQKSLEACDDRLGCPIRFHRNPSAPEFSAGDSVSSITSDNDLIRSPLAVYQQAPSSMSSIAILNRETKSSNSSSDAGSTAEMHTTSLQNRYVSTTPRMTSGSNHRTPVRQAFSFNTQRHNPHHQPQNSTTSSSTTAEGYIQLSDTTSNASLPTRGSASLQRSNSSDMARPRPHETDTHLTATIVNHNLSLPLESPQIPTRTRASAGGPIPHQLLAFYSTQKLSKSKRNSREECGSSNTTLSDARSYEDLFEAKLASEQASDFESESGSGSFVNPGFEYSLDPSISLNSQVPLRRHSKNWTRIGKSSSFNAGDIQPHCQSNSNSSGSGGVVTGEAMSFSADSIARRPQKFWTTMDGRKNIPAENYSSLRHDASIGSVHEEIEETTETKNNALKHAKIKNLLPNPKKLKQAFQKPKSNESI